MSQINDDEKAIGDQLPKPAETSPGPPAPQTTDSQEPNKAATDKAVESSHTTDKSDKSADTAKSEGNGDQKKGPAGGFDQTPIPKTSPGWTIKITFHKAENLPPADISTLSSDPYVLAQLYCYNPTRHKEDPPLRHRTFTVQKNVNPVWNDEWIVANVPSHGFKLKCRLYDEDPSDHDDRLGNAHIDVGQIDEAWRGINQGVFRLKKRMGSKRAYLVQAIEAGLRQRHSMTGHLVVSISLVGRTESQHEGRVYTVGPMRWMKHYSPILGRIVNKKTATEDDGEPKPEKNKTERYNFQANQFQLCGPVPAPLYHRYVEFKGFVKGMFTGAGIRGHFLHKALSHQHHQIYRFDKKTEYGYLSDKPSVEGTDKFLELVSYDEGGRIFTYVITLDGMLRFTETGKEFGIDMLSKHTMHSDVSIYIAYSGEFFVRRQPGAVSDTSQDPSNFELVIDNDSGTYRPKAGLLSDLKSFLEWNFPGLHVKTLDCVENGDEEQELKKIQKEKKEAGQQLVYRQTHGGRSSSISSSDESDLDEIAAEGSKEPGILKTVKKDLSVRGKTKKERLKGYARAPKDVKNLKSGQSDGTNGAQATNETNGTNVAESTVNKP